MSALRSACPTCESSSSKPASTAESSSPASPFAAESLHERPHSDSQEKWHHAAMYFPVTRETALSLAAFAAIQKKLREHHGDTDHLPHKKPPRPPPRTSVIFDDVREPKEHKIDSRDELRGTMDRRPEHRTEKNTPPRESRILPRSGWHNPEEYRGSRPWAL